MKSQEFRTHETRDTGEWQSREITIKTERQAEIQVSCIR
jgi:hypothetical protein